MIVLTQGGIYALMRKIASGLQTPVVVILIALLVLAVLCLGSLIAEFFSEHRHLKINMPVLMERIREGEVPVDECIEESSLLKRQKSFLTELTRHPDMTPEMREALAVRLLFREKRYYEKIVKITDVIAKLGPVFGLLGTLIPLGPGIIALSKGNTMVLSDSLLTAFDTTILGLITAAAAMLISTIRKGWYKDYISVSGALTDCILEVEKNDKQTEE